MNSDNKGKTALHAFCTKTILVTICAHLNALNLIHACRNWGLTMFYNLLEKVRGQVTLIHGSQSTQAKNFRFFQHFPGLQKTMAFQNCAITANVT